MVVGDNDFGPIQIVEHVIRDPFAARIVAIRIVDLKSTKPVADGPSGFASLLALAMSLRIGCSKNRLSILNYSPHGHRYGFRCSSHGV